MLRFVLGLSVGLLARLWLMTLRVRVVVHPSLDVGGERPWVLAFLHGKQWPLLAWKRRRSTVVMVSLSRDGEMQSRALALQGFRVVRGSSSRGGARGLAAVIREVRGGERDAAFAVDGPRGPYGVPKPGAVLAARRSRALLVPMGSATASGKVFHRAWDRFELAWPFSRVAVVLGAPVEAVEGELDSSLQARLAGEIAAANAAAEAILADARADMITFSRSLPDHGAAPRDV